MGLRSTQRTLVLERYFIIVQEATCTFEDQHLLSLYYSQVQVERINIKVEEDKKKNVCIGIGEK